MPGFVVNGFGLGASPNVNPYYSYTWELEEFYGDTIGRNPAGPLAPLIYIKDMTLPSWEFTKIEARGGSLVYKFADSIKWNDVKLVWYDTLGLAAKIQQWREAIWTSTKGLQPANNYKQQSLLRSLTFSWRNPIGWKLINSWPASVKQSDLTYTESSIKLTEVMLTYDWAEDIVDGGGLVNRRRLPVVAQAE